MATIKIKRGTGQPALTGLTAYEPAWDTTNNRLFIHNGSTAMWIGAQIDNNTSLAGNCAFTIPTQNAVKTYVDSQVAGGAVSTLNGATGAVTIGGGTAIAIATSTAARGITVTNTGVWSVNGNTGAVSNIAVTNAAQTFTGTQSFISGICAGPGSTFNISVFVRGTAVGIDGATSGQLRIGNDLGQDAGFAAIVKEAGNNKRTTTILGNSDGYFVTSTTDGAATNRILRAQGSGITPIWIDPESPTTGLSAYWSNRTDRILMQDASGAMFLTLSGGKTGYQQQFTSNSATWNETTGLLTVANANFTSGVTIASLRTTSIANFVGGLCASGGTFSGSLTLNGNAVTTVANTVASIAGTANQITANGSTGSVTLSLPSTLIAPGSLTVTGDLTVNGTTTTVNSTTVTVQDPLIAIGGLTGNIPPVTGDVKDRGILFQYFDAAGRTGFFGHDTSTGRFTYIPIVTSVSGEVVTGPAGIAEFSGVRAPNQTLTLVGVSGANATVTLNGAATAAATSIVNTAYETVITSATGIGRLAIAGDILDPANEGIITTSAFTAARTFTLPDITGTFPVATTGGATSGWILRGQGATTVNTWINPAASGFTAFTSTNVNLVAVKDAVNYGLVFALGTAGNQTLYGDSTTGVMWRPSTNTLTVGGGLGFFEGIVDGGAF